MAQNVRKGARLLFISTNDGWWEDSPGHRQHAAYARLRAIENRRDIAQSANTGTSCFINQRGDMIQKTDYGIHDVLNGAMRSNQELTFYTLHGDLIGRIALGTSIMLLILSFTYGFFPKARRNIN